MHRFVVPFTRDIFLAIPVLFLTLEQELKYTLAAIVLLKSFMEYEDDVFSRKGNSLLTRISYEKIEPGCAYHTAPRSIFLAYNKDIVLVSFPRGVK